MVLVVEDGGQCPMVCKVGGINSRQPIQKSPKSLVTYTGRLLGDYLLLCTVALCATLSLQQQGWKKSDITKTMVDLKDHN